MNKTKIQQVTQGAVLMALLVAVQFITRPFGQLVTGSLVNLILLVSVFFTGMWGGIIVAVLSPVLAFTVGVGPAFPQIVAFVSMGNVLFVTVAYLAGCKAVQDQEKTNMILLALSLVAAAVVKFIFLWVAIVRLALPFLPGINEKQAAMLGQSFSYPQLITALVGGAMALVLIPLLKRALKR